MPQISPKGMGIHVMHVLIVYLTDYERECWDDWDEFDEEDHSPTGHGDICYSDADPGL